ncbi:MAG: hypothetical protein ACREJO_08890 [Phycisphaerales bacterium]
MQDEQPRFEILAGLPPYGPSPFPFPTSGRGSHSEGLVVRFFPRRGASWVGNFQRGATDLSAVERHPDGKRLIVISEGTAYLIDPECPGVGPEIGGIYGSTLRTSTLLLLVTWIYIDAHGPNGHRWRTRRLSWNGIRAVHLSEDGTTVHGEALTLEDTWVPFKIDIETGEAHGGSYQDPAAARVRASGHSGPGFLRNTYAAVLNGISRLLPQSRP